MKRSIVPVVGQDMNENELNFINVMRIYAKLEVERTMRRLVLYSEMEHSLEDAQGQSFEGKIPQVDWPPLQDMSEAD